jgi:class 3 adenylate cyclase
MIDVIHAHRGIIVDFVGDGLLVFFEPVDELLPDTACRAVHCAKAMQGSLPALNDLLSGQNLPPLAIGIGLNAGEVVVGNIGSAARAKYGIVGAAVNMTQRIQSEAGSGEIVVSDTVYRHAACHLSLERAFSARPKGIDQDVALYVLTGEAAAAARPEGALP